jgi:dynein intermediate chain 2
MNGSVDIWDYTLKQNEPCLTVQVSQAPLQSMKVQDHGSLLAVTACDGSTTLLELSDSLSKIQNNEKNIFSQMMERENKREKTLESILREKRLKASQKRPQSGQERGLSDAVVSAIKETEDSFKSQFGQAA